KLNQTVKKVGEDLNQIKSNTAVAALMEWLNYLTKKEKVSKIEYETLVLLLAPFAPHISEELWTTYLANSFSVHNQNWPKVDESLLQDEQVEIAIQVNGKLRDLILISSDVLDNKEDIENQALKRDKIQKYLN